MSGSILDTRIGPKSFTTPAITPRGLLRRWNKRADKIKAACCTAAGAALL